MGRTLELCLAMLPQGAAQAALSGLCIMWVQIQQHCLLAFAQRCCFDLLLIAGAGQQAAGREAQALSLNQHQETEMRWPNMLGGCSWCSFQVRAAGPAARITTAAQGAMLAILLLLLHKLERAWHQEHNDRRQLAVPALEVGQGLGAPTAPLLRADTHTNTGSVTNLMMIADCAPLSAATASQQSPICCFSRLCIYPSNALLSYNMSKLHILLIHPILE